MDPGRFLRALLLVTSFWAAVPSMLPAQINDPAIKPINVTPLETKRPIVEYVLAGGFIIAALAIGFKPSKRTNEA